MKQNKLTILVIVLCAMVYIVITVFFANKGYFWDNTQHTSIEAHYFYLSNFHSFFIPKNIPEWDISSTGAPVFLPLLTAFLWKYIAYKVWISHAIAFGFLILLFYNSYKLTRNYIGKERGIWAFAVLILESSVLSQYAIAGPDFILFAVFVVLLRAALEKNHKSILAFSPILFLISTRGTFTGATLFLSIIISSIYLKECSVNKKIIRAFLPAIILTIAYYSSYFVTEGWFFSDSKFGNAHTFPSDFREIIFNYLDLGLRLLENGRFIFWLLAFYAIFNLIKKKQKPEGDFFFIAILLILLCALYGLFATITKMPFLTRYFMPHVLLLILIAFKNGLLSLNNTQFKKAIALVLVVVLTGNFWIYPEKMTTIWDSTLAHAPFYKLRNDCYNYIDSAAINYNDMSAGFCLYDNRRFYDLTNTSKSISRSNDKPYFIYSNISGVTDELFDELYNPKKWRKMKEFKQWPVRICIFGRIHKAENTVIR